MSLQALDSINGYKKPKWSSFHTAFSLHFLLTSASLPNTETEGQRIWELGRLKLKRALRRKRVRADVLMDRTEAHQKKGWRWPWFFGPLFIVYWGGSNIETRGSKEAARGFRISGSCPSDVWGSWVFIRYSSFFSNSPLLSVEPQCNILCAFESAITLRFPITDWKSLFSFVLLFDNSLSLLLPLLHGAGWEGLKHTIECHQSTEGCNRSDRAGADSIIHLETRLRTSRRMWTIRRMFMWMPSGRILWYAFWPLYLVLLAVVGGPASLVTSACSGHTGSAFFYPKRRVNRETRRLSVFSFCLF